MNLEDLKKIDSTLSLVFGEEKNVNFETISHAYDPQAESFIFIKNKKFLNEIGRLSKGDDFLHSGIIIEKSFYDKAHKDKEFSDTLNKFLWGAIVDDINKSMCSFSKLIYDKKYGELNYFVDGRQMGSAKIDPSAKIAQNVFIGENVEIAQGVQIHPGVVILPDSKISKDTIIFPNVTIYPYTNIGENCRIHSGTSIGTDGFGYNFIDGVHTKIWHLAGVEIGNNVEIGSSSKIDGGAFIPTRIGEGTKIDNLVQISHNAQIGKHNIFAGKSGVAGSAETQSYCVFAASAGTAPGARLGQGCQVAALSVVSENAIIPAGSVLSGHPARPLKEWLKSQAKLRQLIKKPSS